MSNAEGRLANQEASPVPPTATMLILSFVPIFLGLGFLYIVLGAWLVTVGFTAVQAGLLISAQGIAVVLTSIPLGIISDIYGRKKLLILGNLAGAAALLVFALTTNFSYLISASVVLGFAEGASVTTWNALLADLTDNSNRNRVFSRSFIMINVTTGIGLVLPGAFPALQSLTGLTNYTLHRETLLILGLASFISPLMFYILLRNHRETHNPGTERPSKRTEQYYVPTAQQSKHLLRRIHTRTRTTTAAVLHCQRILHNRTHSLLHLLRSDQAIRGANSFPKLGIGSLRPARASAVQTLSRVGSVADLCICREPGRCEFRRKGESAKRVFPNQLFESNTCDAAGSYGIGISTPGRG